MTNPLSARFAAASSTPPTPGTHDSELRTAAGVSALRHLFLDDSVVHQIATAYPSWERLAAAHPTELLPLVTPHSHVLPPIPANMPRPPAPPAGVERVTRYQADYPRGLREAATPPALLYVAGHLPTKPAMSVIGATHPSPLGVEIARAAGRAAAALDVPLVVPLTTGCSMLAAQTALDLEARVVLVVPHGLATGSSYQSLLERALAHGGAVLSPFEPSVPTAAGHADTAASIAVLVSQAVILAEVGTFPGAAHGPASTAVHAGRYLISPAPQNGAEPGRWLPPSALGSAIFSSAREWTPEHFGTNHRIQQRCRDGLAPADAVVDGPADLANALKAAFAHPQHPTD